MFRVKLFPSQNRPSFLHLYMPIVLASVLPLKMGGARFDRVRVEFHCLNIVWLGFRHCNVRWSKVVLPSYLFVNLLLCEAEIDNLPTSQNHNFLHHTNQPTNSHWAPQPPVAQTFDSPWSPLITANSSTQIKFHQPR